MKILTGTLRGQTIFFKPNPHLRPTSDKARKAMFDMLQGAFEDTRVLDLFSGTGALGYEALSQGAAHVTFVENDGAQCKKIAENLKRLKLEEKTSVSEADAFDWVNAQKKQRAFDFIFLDPPYAYDLATQALEAIEKKELLSKKGFIVVECRRKDDVEEKIGSLAMVREKRYGQTKVLFYVRHQNIGGRPLTL